MSCLCGLKNLDTTNLQKRTFKNKIIYGKLIRVIDGDTIIVASKMNNKEDYFEYTIRLSGIDTPELRPRRDDPNNELHKNAGYVAKNAVINLMRDYEFVRLSVKNKDSFGRYVCVVEIGIINCVGCYRNKINLNNWLLENEYAKKVNRNRAESFSVEFLNNIVSKKIE